MQTLITGSIGPENATYSPSIIHRGAVSGNRCRRRINADPRITDPGGPVRPARVSIAGLRYEISVGCPLKGGSDPSILAPWKQIRTSAWAVI